MATVTSTSATASLAPRVQSHETREAPLRSAKSDARLDGSCPRGKSQFLGSRERRGICRCLGAGDPVDGPQEIHAHQRQDQGEHQDARGNDGDSPALGAAPDGPFAQQEQHAPHGVSWRMTSDALMSIFDGKSHSTRVIVTPSW